MEQTVMTELLGESLCKKFRGRNYRLYELLKGEGNTRFVVELCDNVSWLGVAPATGLGMDPRSAAVNAFLDERMRASH
jgi:hypothetical protein